MRIPPPRKRCRRLDEPWQAHHLTFSCFRRQPFFLGRQSPDWFLECLDTARRLAGFDLWAYVIMPEHVHLVILPHDEAAIRDILFRMKRPMTAKVLNWVTGHNPEFLIRMTRRHANGTSTYHFWQAGGGYDRNLRSAREIYEKIGYVHDNPVRRKLVPAAELWTWSSAQCWLTGQQGQIRLDLESLPESGG
jgi:putative transposase